MNLQALKRGIQIQQGEGADELIIRSGLPVEQARGKKAPRLSSLKKLSENSFL